jgi:hypothetical protein
MRVQTAELNPAGTIFDFQYFEHQVELQRQPDGVKTGSQVRRGRRHPDLRRPADSMSFVSPLQKLSFPSSLGQCLLQYRAHDVLRRVMTQPQLLLA